MPENPYAIARRDYKVAYEALQEYGVRRFGDEFWPGNNKTFILLMESAGFAHGDICACGGTRKNCPCE